MRQHAVGLLSASLFLTLAGCRLIDERPAAAPSEPTAQPTPAAPAAAPESAATGATSAAPTGSPAAPASAPGEPAASGPPEAAPTGPAPEATPPEGAATTVGGTTVEVKPPLPGILDTVSDAAREAAGQQVAAAGGPGALGAEIAQASRDSVQAAAARAELAKARAAAQAEREEIARRRTLYVTQAGYYLDYVQYHVREQNQERAFGQLALLHQQLEGVHANLGKGLALDELAFALAELYHREVVERNQDEAVDAALRHLRAALRVLPEPAPAPASTSVRPGDAAAAETPAPAAATLSGDRSPLDDPALLAREVTEIVGLLETRQRATGRSRLQVLVLEGAADEPATLLEMLEAARMSVSDAVGRKAWKRAAWGLERMQRLLGELQQLVGVTPKPTSGAGAAGAANAPPAPAEAAPPAAELPPATAGAGT